MEILFELVFQFLGEIVLQIVFEILAEVGIQSLKRAVKRSPVNPVLATIGHGILGAAAGGVSLLVLPNHLIRTLWARWLSLAVTAVGAGLAMSLLGRLRKKQGKDLVRLDSFSYGFLFALSM